VKTWFLKILSELDYIGSMQQLAAEEIKISK